MENAIMNPIVETGTIVVLEEDADKLSAALRSAGYDVSIKRIFRNNKDFSGMYAIGFEIANKSLIQEVYPLVAAQHTK